jgi:hypothetical protein
MPFSRLARARLAPRTILATLVLAMCAAVMLAAATPASAVTRKQATKKALAALGSKTAGDGVIVFGLPKPLRPGSLVTQAGTKKTVAKVGRERAFFFYQDARPFQAYPHPGRVALVSVKRGKVKLSKTFKRAPLINGKLPAFLKSRKAYNSPEYVVLDTFTSTPVGPEPSNGPSGTSDPFGAIDGSAGPNSPPKADGRSITVKQGGFRDVTLTGSDDDGDELEYFITRQPARGTLSGGPPNVTYTPNAAYLGPDHFTFKVNDGQADSNAAQISITVVPRGIASTVMTSSGCTAYTEQEPAVVVDGQLTALDADDMTLESASVRIASNFEGGDDLVFADQNGITGSYSDNTGTLTLKGTSSVANYQAALRTVGYRNLTSSNPAATKNIEFTANDGGGPSAPATKQVCISGGTPSENDPPVAEASPGTLDYIENDGPVAIDPSRPTDDPDVPEAGGFVVTDPDSATLSGATISFAESQPGSGTPTPPPPGTAPPGSGEEGDPENPTGQPLSASASTTSTSYVPGQDVLAFTDQNGITGDWDDVNGVLTLSGSASPAAYQQAIRSVTYENTSDDPSADPRLLRFQVTDSDGANSGVASRGIQVTPVNDAPTVTTSPGPTSYTGNDAPVAVDSGVVPFDVDDTHLEGAKVTITDAENGDVLGFSDQNGITGSYDSGTGVLTLSGSATEAHYQTALRSVTYSNSQGNPSGSRTVEFVVNDGDLDSAAASKTVEVNDKPVLDTSDTALSYTENDGPVAVDAGITATDADTATLAGATVTIGANFASAEDELDFSDQNGITGSYNDSTGVLTLAGTASVADYQAALRSVTYENSSDNPSAATRTVSFKADDGQSFNNLSDPATRDVAITPVNDAPEVDTSAGSTSYTEGDAATAVDSALTVSDVDDTSLEGAQVSISAGHESGDELVFAAQLGITGGYDSGTGVLTLSGTASVADYQTALRSIEFRHTGDNPAASKTVQFKVNDGAADSSAAAKDIAVTGVNDKPSLDASDAALAYTEGDGAVAVDAGIDASDPDSATLSGATVAITGSFSADEDELAFADGNGITGGYSDSTGVLTLSGVASVAAYEAALRSVTYENSSDDPSATRTVSFQANDGGATDNLSDTVTRDIAITATNDAPSVTTSAGSTPYTIGDTAGVPVDGDLSVADADNANLEGAQVSISAANLESGDELVFATQLGISGAYDSGTGVLTLSGTASPADYQTALRSIKFRHTGSSPAASKTVEFKVDDGDAESAPATKDIALSAPPPNEAPVVTTSTGNTSYTAGDTAGVEVDPALTVSDADDASLEGATVTVSTGLDASDELVFATQLGISGAYDSGTGVLTLSGTASPADYQTALRSIKFRSGSAAGTPKEIEFKVNDGDLDSAAALKAIDIV